MTTTIGVYCFTNQTTGKHYVGSSIDIARRKRTHLRLLRAGKSGLTKLQRSWTKHSESVFEFSTLEIFSEPVDDKTLRAAEQRWMDKLDSVVGGYNTNPNAGLIGKLPKSTQHRANIGAARKGQTHSAETKKLLSDSAKARAKHTRVRSAEAVAKTAAANRGKKRTAEQCARIALGRLGKTFSPLSQEHKEALAASKRGKPLSAYHCQRISEGHKARKEALCL